MRTSTKGVKRTNEEQKNIMPRCKQKIYRYTLNTII